MIRQSERGITLIEITVVLACAAILAAAMAPVASRTVERSRLTRVLADESAISTALSNFISELPGTYFGPKADGTVSTATAVQMLVSDGDTPREVGPAGDGRWDDPVGVGGGGLLIVDFMENHLVQNQPFGDPTKPYPSNWRGAYISSPVDPDPWGNRYAVNTDFLAGAAANRRNDTFVLSSGPDEQIDTTWQMDGAVAGDDDIITIVRRDTGLTVP